MGPLVKWSLWNVLTNLVLLCRFHHRLVHRKNLTLHFDTDGVTLIVQWPNGRTFRSPPLGALGL